MQLKTFWGRKAASMAAVFVGLSVFGSCSEDSPTDTTPPPPTPVLDTVDETVVSPGDTIVLTGSDFAVPAINNIVFFNNAIFGATPLSSDGSTMRVVVPLNANSGGMWVRSLGVNSETLTMEIQRGVGEPWIVGQGGSFDLKLATPQGSERYLVVPHPAITGAVLTYPYTVTPSAATVYPSSPVEDEKEFVPLLTFREKFKNTIWDETERYINSNPPQRRMPRPALSAEPAGMRTFNVLKCQCSSSNANNFEQITAELKYSGSHALIYADVNQPTGSYTQTDYNNFGQEFDNSIFPTDTTAFGPPTDIDGNDRIIILFSPVVNEITPDGTWRSQGFVSGFFLPNDLAPNVYGAGTTNSSEIFYSIVPDPQNEYGNDFDRATLLSIIPGTLAHEFEHMISFGYRYWTLGNGSTFGFTQERWFEEGMAHIAEDLNGFDSQNVARGNLYLADPASVSLFQGDDSLQQRGGIFLFLRYLGDRYGESIYRELVEASCVGTGCTQAVLGKDFFELAGDFFATMYLSDRGITSDPKYNFSSFNFQQLYAPLPVVERAFGAGTFNGAARNGAAEYWLLRNGSDPAMEVNITASSSSRMRLLIVRTQ